MDTFPSAAGTTSIMDRVTEICDQLMQQGYFDVFTTAKEKIHGLEKAAPHPATHAMGVQLKVGETADLSSCIQGAKDTARHYILKGVLRHFKTLHRPKDV